jgi:polysaccharide deacetylase 2 family uncharacterized protein YibQ
MTYSRDDKSNHRIKSKWIACLILTCSIMLLGAPFVTSQAQSSESSVDEWPWPWKAKIAIVIDRLGSGMGGTEQLFKLHIPMTVAIMPNGPFTASDAEKARKTGKEMILHVPMQTHTGNFSRQVQGSLYPSMPVTEAQAMLEQQLRAVPHVVGLSNRGGSKVNSSAALMDTVFQVAKKHKLYFLDSSRPGNAVIRQSAIHHGVPTVQNVFVIDDYFDVSYIKQRLRKAVRSAHINGHAVVIGHVGIQGELTMKAIEQSIPMFIRQRVKLVYVSEIIEDMR